MSTVTVVVLVVAVCWLVTRDWRYERGERAQAEWDAWIADALAVSGDPDPAGDLTYQQLCFERWEAEL